MSDGLDLIGELIATVHNIPTIQIKGRRRDKALVQCRVEITHFATACGYGVDEIAAWMGKDPSSIEYHLRRGG